MAAVLLRRLYTTTFEEFWPQFTPEIQASIKEQMLLSVQQEPSAILRRKMCDCTAEFARNMLGWCIFKLHGHNMSGFPVADLGKILKRRVHVDFPVTQFI